MTDCSDGRARIQSLSRYAGLAESIHAFWIERKNQKSRTWTEHRDINMVMLAISLSPERYLSLY